MVFRSVFCGTLACAAVLSTLPQASALTAVSGWATTEVAAAEQANLVPDSLSKQSATGSITRAEFCGIALRLYESLRQTTVSPVTDSPFTDTDSQTVATAYALGLVSGRSATTFDPDGQLTRQELCKMLTNVLTAADVSADDADLDTLAAYTDAGQVETWAQNAVSLMLSHGVMGGVSTRQDDPTGEVQTIITLAPAAATTREQALLVSLRFSKAFATDADGQGTETDQDTASNGEAVATDPENNGTSTDTDPENGGAATDTDSADSGTFAPATPPQHLTLPDVLPATHAEKMQYVFGETAAYYTEEAVAETAMTELSVPVWRLQDNGAKTADTAYIMVNVALVPLYEAIFQEIFDGAQQFPIHDVGGYAWRASASSEHRQGTAIDINYDSNMECNVDEAGTVTAITCGSTWSPDTDPYAITEDSDVYRAFTKYGFSWGGNAWDTKRDYMHFSYFGT